MNPALLECILIILTNAIITIALIYEFDRMRSDVTELSDKVEDLNNDLNNLEEKCYETDNKTKTND